MYTVLLFTSFIYVIVNQLPDEKAECAKHEATSWVGAPPVQTCRPGNFPLTDSSRRGFVAPGAT